MRGAAAFDIRGLCVNYQAPQFVNLYRRDRSWRTRILRLSDSLTAMVVLVVGLGALTAYGQWRLSDAETAASQAAIEFEARNAGLVAAGAVYQTREDYQKLQRRVGNLQQMIARQDVVLGRMNNTVLGTSEGFSKRMAAVARARVDGVWLTQIEIDLSQAKLRLAGVAMSADLLPSYLVELRFEPALGLGRLSNLTLDRAVNDERAAQSGAVAFSLLQSEPELVAGL